MEHSVQRRIDMTRLLKLILISSAFLLTACGGGGGGGEETPEPITYTGLKTPALINTSNASVLVGGIMGSELESSLNNTIGVVTDEAESGTSLPASLIMLQTLANTARQIDITGAAVLPGTIQTNTETQLCDSGSITVSIAVDDVSGEFSGTMIYDACVISGVYMNGTIKVTGLFDPALLEITQMNMTFTDLTQSYGTESYTQSGSIAASFSGSTSVLVANYLVRDNHTLAVYMYANYRVESTDNITEALIRLSGRFFHPDYGYVDISTLNTIHMNSTDDWPYLGIVLATGDNSSLMVDCEGDSILTYTLSVDADGDGNYESVTLENW
jgi:hypothetical protein